MKIPKNMTEEELLKTMKIVINRIAPKYTFYGYPVEDIKQESYIICIEALNRYDETRPLENFLSVNLSNRLKNFLRDNYFVCSIENERSKIIQPAQLDYEENLVDNEEKFSVDKEKIDNSYLIENIDEFLPASMRMDYLKIINSVYVSKNRKAEIMEKLDEIIEEIGYEKG